ncbi:hypothetical protein [Nocardioides pelophilus]|uniref:hypothetical protein n=1 Tax=Nocardioides pelophilus TaxID=2172019 RepID=UPI0016006A32|nr:hypothetical protein [Nocardioides pelophilus]
MSKPPAGQADLRLENALLTNELRHLRAELANVRRQLRAARSRVKELQAAGGTAAAPDDEATTPKMRRTRKLEAQALDDMHWLVNRVDRSPIGPLLRRREGFRTLKQRYGTDPRA